MELTNDSLKILLENYKKKSNKDLSRDLMTLQHDFEQIKNTMLKLAQTISEVEYVHDKIYVELQERLKFTDVKPTTNGDGN